jgi:hypothetical protein
MAKKCWIDVIRNHDKVGDIPYPTCSYPTCSGADDCQDASEILEEGGRLENCRYWRESKNWETKVEKYEEIKLLLNMQDARSVKECLDYCAKQKRYSDIRDDLKGLSDAMKAMGVE